MSGTERQSIKEEAVKMTNFEVMQKVRAKMNELYQAMDAFKANLVNDAAELINQQIRSFSNKVAEYNKSSPSKND